MTRVFKKNCDFRAPNQRRIGARLSVTAGAPYLRKSRVSANFPLKNCHLYCCFFLSTQYSPGRSGEPKNPFSCWWKNGCLRDHEKISFVLQLDPSRRARKFFKKKAISPWNTRAKWRLLQWPREDSTPNSALNWRHSVSAFDFPPEKPRRPTGRGCLRSTKIPPAARWNLADEEGLISPHYRCHHLQFRRDPPVLYRRYPHCRHTHHQRLAEIPPEENTGGRAPGLRSNNFKSDDRRKNMWNLKIFILMS